VRKCRFPYAGDLSSTSGPDVLVAAITTAIRDDPRFANLNDHPWGPDDIAWYPVGHAWIWDAMKKGQPFAVGPNVLYGSSQQPGACDGEAQLMAYQNYAAIFTLSRWYSALQQKHFAQKSKHYILDYPNPWLESKLVTTQDTDAFIFIKGGDAEKQVAREIRINGQIVPVVVGYGRYTRDVLFDTARRSKVCFYISREDHYPLAAVEITLMGCPIVSDERSCPVLRHGINGIIAAVRERGESDPFVWAKDAAERMAVEYSGACKLDRAMVRAATIAAHDPALMRERVAAQLGLG
jgi:hypothetical protein